MIHRIRLFLSFLLLMTFSFGFCQDIGEQFREKYGYYPDYASYQRVTFIGSRLALAAGINNASFQILNDDEYNAFALPDGRMYITSGLLMDATDAQVAFILGHEVTHVVQKHSKKQNNATLAAVLLGYIGTKAVGGDDKDAQVVAGIAGALASGQYSQKDEMRADEGGIKYMTMLGYNPEEAALGIKLLLDRYGRGDATIPLLGLFVSHPDTEKRYNKLVEIAEKYKTNPPEKIDNVRCVTVSISEESLDKNRWLIDYAMTVLPDATRGKVAALPSKDYFAPLLPLEYIRSNNENLPTAYKIVSYTVTENSGAEYHLSIKTAFVDWKTARVTIDWTHSSGTSGSITVDSFNVNNGIVTGIAADELTDKNRMLALSDGENDNSEGTSIASALRRALRAFNDVIENGNQPFLATDRVFNVKLDPKKFVVGDYVCIVRNNTVIGEARVEMFTKKDYADIRLVWGKMVAKIEKKDSIIKSI